MLWMLCDRFVMTVFQGNRALLDAFRAGERHALERVYREYHGVLYGLFRHGFAAGGSGRVAGCRQVADVEDLVQETFRKAFEVRARTSYDGVRPFRAWLLQLARNLAVDRLRKRGEVLMTQHQDDPAPPDIEALSIEPPAPPDAETEQEARELHALVEQFVARLSERERLVFHARFRDRLSVREAVERTGLTTMRVRTTEKAVRARLLAHVQAAGYLARLPPYAVGAAMMLVAVVLVVACAWTAVERRTQRLDRGVTRCHA
jgi:RNA polymerase sigma factor (sigma-70 family)